MPTYELTPFRLDDAALVADWFLDADDVAQVTGERRFPIDADDLVVWSYEATRAYLLTEDDFPVAYGEIVEDDAEGDVEIGRLIVAPSWRERPAGEVLVKMLADKVETSFNYDETWLRVSRENARQLSYAVTNGFHEAPECSGEKYIWLRKPNAYHS
jgi:predicted GNAT family N-acyltransferase